VLRSAAGPAHIDGMDPKSLHPKGPLPSEAMIELREVSEVSLIGLAFVFITGVRHITHLSCVSRVMFGHEQNTGRANMKKHLSRETDLVLMMAFRPRSARHKYHGISIFMAYFSLYFYN